MLRGKKERETPIEFWGSQETDLSPGSEWNPALYEAYPEWDVVCPRVPGVS